MSDVVGQRWRAVLTRVVPARAARALGVIALVGSVALGSSGALPPPAAAQAACGGGGLAGCRLAIGGTVDGTLPPDAGRHQYELEVPAMNGMVFSPDGRAVAITHGATVGVWRTSDLTPAWGHPAGTVSEPCTAFGQSPPRVRGLAYSLDGTLLATGSTAPGPAASIWRVSDGDLVRSLVTPEPSSPLAPARYIAFSPDGRLLATLSGGNVLGLWRVEDGALLQELAIGSEPGAGTEPTHLAFTRDGQRLFSGSSGAAMHVWGVR